MKTWFHIGYPKAGSTTLQKHFFNKHPEINFLGAYPTGNTGKDTDTMDLETSFLKIPEVKDFHKRLTMNDLYDHIEEKKALNQLIYKTNPNKPVQLLSNERISSVFFSFPDIKAKLQRIKELGISGIIITVRNQLNIIKSQYREHPFHPTDLIHGKSIDINRWILESNKLQYSYLQSLRFDKIIEYCHELFDKENVVIFSFEEMLQSPDLVSDRISKSLNINRETSKFLLSNLPNENIGVSARYNQVRYWKKKVIGEFPISNFIPDSIIKKSKGFLKKGAKSQISIEEETIQFLINYFGECNSSLNTQYGVTSLYHFE